MVEELRTVSTPQGMIQYLLAVKKVKNMNLRVRPDGSVLGTIGGGAVEHLAVQEAKALWAHGGGPVRRHYDLTPGAAELGMVCGGDIDVEFEVRK